LHGDVIIFLYVSEESREDDWTLDVDLEANPLYESGHFEDIVNAGGGREYLDCQMGRQSKEEISFVYL
jgi:hypothetical protein